MKRSNSQPTTTATATATQATVSFATSNTLPVPAPYHYTNHHNNNNNSLTRSPTRVSPTDDASDDLFGSAAWRKKRSKRGGGKKSGSGRAEHDGKGDDAPDTKRWACVRLAEQRARRVRGHARALGRWCRSACERLDRLLRREAGPEAGADGVGRKGGSAVGTADSRPAAAADEGSGSERRELTSEALAQETRLLCQNYIYHRLCSKALMSKRVPVAAHHSLIADELFAAGQELERLYPRVYTDVSRRISMTMTSAQLVRRALTSVLEDVFRSGVTWARLLSMVAVAAAFAEECVVQGHPGFVEDVVLCVGHFVALRLAPWLRRHGGWDSFPTSRPPAVLEDPDEGSGPLLVLLLLLVSGVLGAAIFLLLLGMRCLGIT